ncbi:hypothetical protein OG921_14260 [Aldersonia sp. NBC_00410]|nr:hypothetical protein [Aldersonia sp. NBC_00410]MCX5044329.1 hypothetical protein [Aldersonia sp. NBC_00410]
MPRYSLEPADDVFLLNRVLTASIANGIAKTRTISRSDSELHGRIH